ncbi:hypothetical protein [Psychrobacter sp. NG254]|nr:hypothetical protein [Psychrobacter sp. NG254]
MISPSAATHLHDNVGMMPGFEPVPRALVGKAFERSVDGFITGEVIVVDA